MRILVGHPGPDFSVADVFTGWVEALRAAGQEVATYALSDRLAFYGHALFETGRADEAGHPEVRKAVSNEEAIRLASNGILSACYQFWPDVVILVSGFFTPPVMLDLMRSRRHKVVLIHTEAPYQDQEQIARAGHADINLVNDPVNLDSYRAVRKDSYYVPHAYRPHVHRPGPAVPSMKCDLGFAGTGYPSRIDFFERMRLAGLDVLLAGNWQPLMEDEHRDSPLHQYLANAADECVDNAQAVSLYRSSKAGINIYRREAESPEQSDGWAMGPREVEMAASGLWFLRDSRPESDEVFPMLPSFSGPEDAGEILRWYLDRDDERQKAADRARAAVAGRTFDANARMLLRLLEKHPGR